MAHMLATGTVLFDTEGRMAALVGFPARSFSAASLTAQALERERYAAACQVEDALDWPPRIVRTAVNCLR